ncbi:hypothetical protein I5M27_14515 [Adhaeribacter sp. BT258]|uniref:DUF6311 domain-containing protein n=1 Tax=Adhaeribacter terrigena TaxID=2793070 RepID=A0ABS1C494_9BACT|nr:hypothetical protein [Adhaeribacter terrigena]MBK0404206.1 hypothetical protein [Adhaeribacter terrigena]
MKNRIAVPIVILLSLALLWLLFGNVLLQPGQYMFGYLEDGTKNYYTAAYFIKYDQGLWFSGLNFPFGEHITYTDNQPLFAVLLNLINQHFAPVAGHTIGIYNGIMLFGIVACAVFLFLILREIKLPVWYAVLAAIIIAFLSPQLFRIRAHYALGYTFMIPMFWYLIIRIFRAPKAIIWYVVYALTGLLAVLIHPYYALINLLLLVSYLLVYYFQEKKIQKINSKLFIGLLAAVLIPLLVFQVYMKLTDPVPDRPESPYGFTAYRTSFKALFFPQEAPLQKPWQAVFGDKEVIWEGYAYLGQAAFVVLLLTLFKFFKFGKRKLWKRIFRPALPAPLRVGLWASVLVLLFALAIPIKWGLEGILDIVPPLKQFRSIGRFAWIFYYIFSVYAAYYLFQLARRFRLQRKPVLAFAIPGILLAFWAFEAINNVHQKAVTIKENRVAANFNGETGNYTQLLQKHNLKPDDFQAILPLPYFNVGSEKITIFRNPEAANEAMRASLHTGLPIAANLLSRTSLNQALQQLQLLSSPFTPKAILEKYPSQKPLLLLVVPDSLEPAEANLVKKASLITKQKAYSLYRLPLDSLYASRNTNKTLPEDLQQKAGMFISDSEGIVIRKDFAGNEGNGMFGKGALALKERKTILIDTLLTVAAGGETYEFSGWASALTPNMPSLTLEVKNQASEVLREEKIYFNASTEVWNNWLFSSHVFNVPAGKMKLTISTKSKKATLDNLLLRPVKTDVYFYFGKQQILFRNNLPASYLRYVTLRKR